jgi:photosystem II stability/assembly factor-like uncharacterized protein
MNNFCAPMLRSVTFSMPLIILFTALASCNPVANIPTTSDTRQSHTSVSLPARSGAIATITTNLGKAEDWTTNGPWGGPVGDLVIDPKNPKILYAGGGSSGVFRSTDGGESWTAFRSGMPYGTGVLDLAIDLSTTSTLYVGTWPGGIYKSTDRGENWTAINNGLPSRCYFSVVAIDPVHPTTLYAGEGTEGKLYKSIDGGARWKAIGDGLPQRNYFHSIAIDPATPTTMYLADLNGLFKSKDGGETWHPADTGIVEGRSDNFMTKDIFAIVIDASTPSTLYAGTNSGLYKSTNGGGNWSLKTDNISEKYFYDIAIDPIIATTLYAASPGEGVFRSVDGGETWTRVGGDFEDHGALDIEIDPQNPPKLFVGTYGGVFKSADYGKTWTNASHGLTLRYIYYLVSDPLLPSTLYVGAYSNMGFKSLDGGKSWNETNLSLETLVINPNNPTIMYGIPYYGGGVVKSVDGGNKWSHIRMDLWGHVFTLTIDPGTNTTLYATTDSHIYKSIDSGINWEAVDTGLPPYEYIPGAWIRAFAIDPSMPSTLYLGFGRGGIFKSMNGGGDWKKIIAWDLLKLLLSIRQTLQRFTPDPIITECIKA